MKKQINHLFALVLKAEVVQAYDELIEDNEIKLVINKKSVLYLVGTSLEFSDGLNGKGFVFNNPNANRTCGCGESFSL